jgi:hypothetical protein
MRLTAVAILRKREGDAAADPLLLGFGADLSTFGFFQRGAVREMLMFVGRTVAKRTEVGCRQVSESEGAKEEERPIGECQLGRNRRWKEGGENGDA